MISQKKNIPAFSQFRLLTELNQLLHAASLLTANIRHFFSSSSYPEGSREPAGNHTGGGLLLIRPKMENLWSLLLHAGGVWAPCAETGDTEKGGHWQQPVRFWFSVLLSCHHHSCFYKRTHFWETIKLTESFALVQLCIGEAPPVPWVPTVWHGQADEVSPTHLDPLLCMNRTHCSHQDHEDTHQTAGSNHRREQGSWLYALWKEVKRHL